MKIKSKKKFIRAIVLIIGIAMGINIIISGKTLSHEELKYKSVAVISGDTLWEIAKAEQESNRYYKNKDIRDIVESIKQLNNLKTSSLSVDQILEIPTY